MALNAVGRGVLSVCVFLLIWEVASMSRFWMKWDAMFWMRDALVAIGQRASYLPWVGAIPGPREVLIASIEVGGQMGFWWSWYQSFARVLSGFIAAMIIGIPFGLLLATSRTFFGVAFPVFEVLRPIPPLAWVPAAIIFWPTQELSIAFVTFLGAFYTIVINVVGGARSIDKRYYQAARSMGSSDWDIFRRVIFPATLPSITIGATVGMGITWEVVVAAEMISGGGSKGEGGLGFFIWNSYVGGSYAQIVVGMVSIGIAGYISSAVIRSLGNWITPWTNRK